MFNISINDDDIVEGNENFILSIDPSSLPNNVTVGVHNQTTVTIFDNDCKFAVWILIHTCECHLLCISFLHSLYREI